MDLVKKGKVRDIYTIDYLKDSIIFYHSDRLSSFDRYICDIEGKGNSLMNLSIWWMNQTKDIIKNHYINHYDNYMLCCKSEVIPLEFIVRGYITGSTNTSLWTHYKNGARSYCGLTFPDGLVKNQKLDTPVLTPTTKDDEHDELISADEIINRNILTREQFIYIEQMALRLFELGQKVADENGLILVDTKYEFGIYNNEIILIDEIHTGDSSRYWIKETYNDLFNAGQEPQKVDKDSVRDYVKSICDPYKEVENIPSPDNIPLEVKNKVISSYHYLYNTLTNNSETDIILGNKTEHHNVNLLIDSLLDNIQVVIFSGSISDKHHVDKLVKFINQFNIRCYQHVISAHKNPVKLLNCLEEYNDMVDKKIIFVTVAGRSNALSGVVAANTQFPVIACPPFRDKMDMMVNINSSLQCPSKVPVLTILDPENVAISCKRIFDL